VFPDLEELTLWNYSMHNYLVGAGKVFPDLEELTLWNYSRHYFLVGAGKVFLDLEELTLWNSSRHNYLVGAGKVFLTWRSSPSGTVLGTTTWWELERCSWPGGAHPLELF
jgi:hypothetical protein